MRQLAAADDDNDGGFVKCSFQSREMPPCQKTYFWHAWRYGKKNQLHSSKVNVINKLQHSVMMQS